MADESAAGDVEEPQPCLVDGLEAECHAVIASVVAGLAADDASDVRGTIGKARRSARPCAALWRDTVRWRAQRLRRLFDFPKAEMYEAVLGEALSADDVRAHGRGAGPQSARCRDGALSRRVSRRRSEGCYSGQRGRTCSDTPS